MLTCYCPFATCAARIPYDAIKPTVCPQCHKAFADAFRTAGATGVNAPTRVRVHDDDPGQERPLTKSALLAARKTSTATARPRPPARTEPSRLMNAPPPPAPVFPDDGADEDDEVVDPREVRRQARELAATIDTSSIHINPGALGEGDKPIRGEVFSFRDIWAEGAAARASAAQAQPAKPKRKARR